MTHIRFERNHSGDERWIEAGADAFAVHMWALDRCDQRETDGLISRVMATRIALPVSPDRAGDAIDALVRLGFWEEASTDGEYRILEYESYALSADEIRQTRERWSRDRRRRRKHSNGVHTECDPKVCKAAAQSPEMSAPDTTGDTGAESGGASPGMSGPLYQTRPNQTKPDQTRPSGARRSGSGSGRRSPTAAVPFARATGMPHGADEELGFNWGPDSPHLYVEPDDAQKCLGCDYQRASIGHSSSAGWEPVNNKQGNSRWRHYAGWEIAVYAGSRYPGETHGSITIDGPGEKALSHLRDILVPYAAQFRTDHHCGDDPHEFCEVTDVDVSEPPPRISLTLPLEGVLHAGYRVQELISNLPISPVIKES